MKVNTRFFRSLIDAVARRHGLDPLVVEAICLTESSGLASAYRYEPRFWLQYLADKEPYKGLMPQRVSASYGLMQVMFPTAQQHGYTGEPEGLFVPATALDYGCRHLRWLLDRCGGRLEQALAQYNGGAGGNQQPPYRNQPYVSKVLAWLETVKEDRGRVVPPTQP
jgi:soluble lytic murein transglycosylase-like protein